MALSELPEGYGTKDVFAVDGNVYLWLPNNEYRFAANGAIWNATVNFGADTPEEAMALVPIQINDTAAAAAGQEKVIKKISQGPGRYDGTWSIAFELDEAKMPEGRKIADTLPVAPAADPSAPRFFKVKTSLRME